MNLAACFHDVQTARSQFYPTITIGASANFSNLTGTMNPGKWTTSLFGSLLQSKPVEARSPLIMMIVIIAVHEGFFIRAKISRVGSNDNFHILIFMKDSPLTF